MVNNNTKVSGIYEIRNTVNGHRYIGSSVDIRGRWRSHLSELRKNEHHSSHLQHAWNKYGEQNFRFSIIETCFSFVLLFREQHYIDSMKPEYNILPIAGNSLGSKRPPMSDEHKKKISDALKGKPAHNKGVPHSEEHKKNISKSLIGHVGARFKHKEITRKKISDALKGRTRKGTPLSQSAKKLLSKLLKGHAVSSETRKKISQAHKGRVHTAESRKNMSDAHKGNTPWNKGRKKNAH